MKNFCIVLLAVLSALPLRAGEPDSLRLVFWNLENFYDWTDQGTSDSDREFSRNGARRWSRKRFYTKCSVFSKVMFSIADDCGGMPDLIGVAEVENETVLKELISSTQLRKFGYRIIHYDSPDPRGIDVALLYRVARFREASGFPVSAGFPTRDILSCLLVTGEGDSLAVFVNHHPSKYGGPESEGRRRSVVARLATLSDSLRHAGWVRQVAVGDFNDEPQNPLYAEVLPDMVNKALPLKERGEGTIKYNGAWELIDLCFVTEELSNVSSFRIFRPPFLVSRDSAHTGYKPLRTYSGPRYLGGVSDHYPVLWVSCL